MKRRQKTAALGAVFRHPFHRTPTRGPRRFRLLRQALTFSSLIISRLADKTGHLTAFDCTCQRYAIMIGLRALRTLPFSFRSLSSVNNGRVAIHRSPVFGSIQIRRVTYSLLDAEPSDDPELFDVLLQDVDHRILNGGVSEELGYTYLSPAAKVLKPIPEINGILFGPHQRPFFTITTTFRQSSYHLHFLFDTNSPFTYLSYPVS